MVHSIQTLRSLIKPLISIVSYSNIWGQHLSQTDSWTFKPDIPITLHLSSMSNLAVRIPEEALLKVFLRSRNMRLSALSMSTNLVISSTESTELDRQYLPLINPAAFSQSHSCPSFTYHKLYQTFSKKTFLFIKYYGNKIFLFTLEKY